MMPTTTLYHWNVAGSPVNILLELPVVDRFRAVAHSSANEVGGILLGHFEGLYTIITDFDAIDSEHRRGSAFTLSRRDEPRLRQQLELHRKRGVTVVGFFRSHLRPGMFLDEGDYQIISSYFHDPNQVALLIRPADDRTAVGGFFFWEHGEMNRKQTYLQFPMSTRELETGDYPLLEPVYNEASEAHLPDPQTAVTQTVYTSDAMPAPLPAAAEMDPVAHPEGPRASNGAATRIRTEKTNPPVSPATLLPKAPKLTWPLIGAIAAVAAFGGYLIGTSGSHRDGFGARPGDIILDNTPNPPEPNPAPTISNAAKPGPMPAPEASNPEAKPPAVAQGAANPNDRPPTPQKVPPAPSTRASGVTLDLQDLPKNAPSQNIEQQSPASDSTAISSAPNATTTPGSPGWQHFGNQPTAAGLGPAPVPAPSIPAAANRAESSVYLEAVEDGGVKRALGKFPLFGHYKGGPDYTPPQAVRSVAPAVPSDLARQITTSTPVDLRLKVDKTGKVSSVEILSKEADSQLVRLAGDAAYGWQFEPARMKDKAVASDVIAHFRFRPTL